MDMPKNSMLLMLNADRQLEDLTSNDAITSDSLDELSDNDILAFSDDLSKTEPPKDDKKDEQKEAKKKEPVKKEVPKSVAQLDEYSSILAYTQDVKANAGVTDSFTAKKTDEDIEEDE